MRLAISKQLLARLKKDSEFYYCFLDEKWFYTTSNRKLYKILPPNKAIGETDKDAAVNVPRCRTRRHPCKTMFLAIVAPPNKDKKFDGKILIKRVCDTVAQKKGSYHQRFSIDYHTNHLIKAGDWRHLHVKNMTPSCLFDAVASTYELDEHEAARLVLTYHTHTKSGEKVFKKLNDNDGDKIICDQKIVTSPGAKERKIQLEDLTLQVEVLSGEHVLRDCSCDSKFMLSMIDEAGRAIRSKFHWVPKEKVIHLFMDNAGGHGTNEAKSKYEDILFDEYNVKIIWQIPNSPETNMLDLGVWCMLQSYVEYIHMGRAMKPDTLSLSVHEAFEDFDGFDKLGEVGLRWKKVLELIMAGNGTNDLVEKCRGIRVPLHDLCMLEALADEIHELDNDESNLVNGVVDNIVVGKRFAKEESNVVVDKGGGCSMITTTVPQGTSNSFDAM